MLLKVALNTINLICGNSEIAQLMSCSLERKTKKRKGYLNNCAVDLGFFINELQGPGGSMSQVVGLPNNSFKPITAWIRARLYKLQKGYTRLAAASDKVYQLLAHGRWFSPGTPASSTTKTGHHDIAEILLKVALNTINQSINITNKTPGC